MKAVLLFFFLLGVVPSYAPSQTPSRLNFHISTAVAREVNRDPRDEYVTEFGDANGPFCNIGSLVVNSASNPSFSVYAKGGIVGSSSGISDPNVMLHVEYFVNEKGNGFAVVHKRPVENPSPREDEEELPEDDRPQDHVLVSDAAASAIASGNTRRLSALFQAGLSVNDPLDWRNGWTALHYTAIFNQPRVAKLLLEHGAELDAKSRYGDRPIDMAFENGAAELCEVLRKPSGNEKQIGGFSEDLLAQVFGSDTTDTQVRFLSFNGKDPSDDMLDFFRRQWPNVRARSQAEEVAPGTPKESKPATSYRDVKTKDHGVVVELELVKVAEDAYDWKYRVASGPFLAGGGSKGKVSKKFGYWIEYDSMGWDE